MKKLSSFLHQKINEGTCHKSNGVPSPLWGGLGRGFAEGETSIKTIPNAIIKLSTILSLFLALTACTVGPDYQTPDTTAPTDWVSDQGNQLSPKAETDQQWWKNFNDPILTKLVTQADENNFDLKIAEARIAQARANVSASEFQLLPTGDVGASAERQANRLAFPSGAGPSFAQLLHKPFNTFQTGFDANWELDLFGGNRRAEESAEAQFQASEANRDDVRVSLMAEVARTYTVIRATQLQLAIANATVASAQKTRDIAEERYNAGQSARLDVTQAEAAWEQTQKQIPALRDQIAQNTLALDVLLGEQPGAAQKIVGDNGALPATDKKLVLTAPAQIIDQRPDIRVAERKLAAATAQQGVATAKFYPDISLSGFFGVLNTSATNLISPANESWSLGGNLMVPILNYGTLSANLDATNAQQQEALATYRKTVLGALSDIERALNAYNEQQKATQSAANETDHDKRAVTTAQERYESGLTSRLDVLQAERVLYEAQNNLIEARAMTTEDLIALYKSLGGGWQKN